MDGYKSEWMGKKTGTNQNGWVNGRVQIRMDG